MCTAFQEKILTPLLSIISAENDSKAFCIEDKFFTYSELNKCISKIRQELSKSDSSIQRVGLVVNNDLETYASIIALWLEGRCYVPLHPGWPIDRCFDIIDQVGMDLILDSSKESRFMNLKVVQTAALTDTQSALLSPKEVSDEELAYILFTSGSTGKPKGVQLTRRNLASFISAFWETGISITKEDQCLQCFDLTFDISIQCFLTGLLRGATIYTVPYDSMKYVYVAGLIDEYRISVATMAPSMLRYMMPYFDDIDASCLRSCIMSAEACPLDILDKLYEWAPNVDIYDFYGPTEGTIYATYYKLSRNGENKSHNGIISIGKGFNGITTIIIDEGGNELSTGEKGELCIAGNQITPGYWNNTAKNQEVFFQKEIAGELHRFYHTGDLCFTDAEGDILYSGRIDFQAKIQGFRVEMGEIEYHARTFLENINAVCIAYETELNVTTLALFVETERFDTSRLTAYLHSKMPAYMVPAKVYFVPSFPINTNGKVDRKQLKSLIK